MRFKDKNMNLYKKTYIAIIFLVCLALISAVMLFRPSYHPKEFDKKVWQRSNNQKGKAIIRIEMATDLLKRKILLNMNREEVKSLLGEPNKIVLNDDEYVYWLGPQSKHSSEAEMLVIKFRNKKVIKAKMVIDGRL